MAMNKNEIDQLISKLKDKYKDYSFKFNPKWFNLEEFEKRYRMAIEKKMNLEAFVLAEIANFEKISQKYEDKMSESTFTSKVDKIIEENNTRIIQYPEIKFQASAGQEISHFYGAMAEFVQFYFPVLWVIAKDFRIKDKLMVYEDKLNFLGMPRTDLPSKRIEEHINILMRRGVPEIDIERDKNDYLKESAFLLHEIHDFCQMLIEDRDPEWEMPLEMDKLIIEEIKLEKITGIFSGLTGYGAIIKINDYAIGIIENFRLQAFKRK